MWGRCQYNSVKLWAMPCRATQDGQVIAESSGKMWSTGEGNGKPPPVYLPWELHELCRRTKLWHQKMSPPGLKVSNILLGKSGGELLRVPERMKQLGQSRNDTQLWMCPVMKVKSNASENNIAQEPVMLGSMNQGKLDVAKQETVRINIHISGISELRWIRMGRFNSDDHYMYYSGQ